jgi:hypothetical protein
MEAQCAPAYAFVKFARVNAVDKAIEYATQGDGIQLDGRQLKVKVARPQGRKTTTNGAGGGRRDHLRDPAQASADAAEKSLRYDAVHSHWKNRKGVVESAQMTLYPNGTLLRTIGKKRPFNGRWFADEWDSEGWAGELIIDWGDEWGKEFLITEDGGASFFVQMEEETKAQGLERTQAKFVMQLPEDPNGVYIPKWLNPQRAAADRVSVERRDPSGTAAALVEQARAQSAFGGGTSDRWRSLASCCVQGDFLRLSQWLPKRSHQFPTESQFFTQWEVDGRTLLMVAAVSGSTKCIQLLLDRNANINAKFNNKKTLTSASFKRQAFQTFTSTEPASELDEKSGWGVLELAAHNNQAAAVDLLLRSGIQDVKRVRQSAAHVAQEAGHVALAEALSDINIANPGQYSGGLGKIVQNNRQIEGVQQDLEGRLKLFVSGQHIYSPLKISRKADPDLKMDSAEKAIAHTRDLLFHLESLYQTATMYELLMQVYQDVVLLWETGDSSQDDFVAQAEGVFHHARLHPTREIGTRVLNKLIEIYLSASKLSAAIDLIRELLAERPLTVRPADVTFEILQVASEKAMLPDLEQLTSEFQTFRRLCAIQKNSAKVDVGALGERVLKCPKFGKVTVFMDQPLGGQCNVYTCKTDEGTCAVKICNTADLTDIKILLDNKGMLKFDHMNIVKYFGSIPTKESQYLVMEKCDGNLTDWITRLPDRHNICRQLIDGIMYLHSRDVCHR